MKLKLIAPALLLIFIPFLAFAQDSTKKKAYYFYGEQCSHCKNVDEYFKANGIYDKYDITKLEFSNPFNARMLVKFGDAFNSEYKGSVPAMAYGDKFLVGDTPIIENFVKEIEAIPAAELPDPEKIKGGAGAAPSVDDQGSDSGNSAGNKKNVFPVVLGALAVVGAGAVIYINRKK